MYPSNNIPWLWKNNFLIKSIIYQHIWKLNKDDGYFFEEDKPKPKDKSNFKEEEAILGILVLEAEPSSSVIPRDLRVYSMFGTNRPIKEFALRIEVDEKEYCHL